MTGARRQHGGRPAAGHSIPVGTTRLTAAQRDEVRVLLGRAYQELFAGYHFSRILVEMVDALDLWHVGGHRSFQVLDRFETFRQANPDTTWNADRALLAATIDTMRLDPHSVAAELFQHHLRPRFGFTRREQHLLEIALEGRDDTSVSKSLFVTVPAIKKRWEASSSVSRRSCLTSVLREATAAEAFKSANASLRISGSIQRN